MLFIKAIEDSVTLSEKRSKLSEKLDLSDFIINNLITEINSDFKQFGLIKELQIVSDRTSVTIKQSGLLVSDLLLPHYLKQSIRFSLLKAIFFKKLTNINDFSTECYLSHTLVYKEFKCLKVILQDLGISITSDFQLIGAESDIRGLVFILLIKKVYINSAIFSNKIIEHTKKFEELLNTTPDVNKPSFSMSARLKIFLGIAITRMNQGHMYDTLPHKYLESKVDANVVERINYWIAESFGIYNRNLANQEVEEIIHFLVVDGWINPDVINSEHSQITKLNAQFLDYVNNQLDLSGKYNTALIWQLNQMHHQILTFPLIAKLEHEKLDISYFMDSYKEYVTICKDYLNEKKADNLLWENKEYLLYKYLITLVSLVPLKEILPPCYLCIDFSLGEQYNQMIRSNVEKVVDTQIVFQNHIDCNTQLILSDLPIYKDQELDYLLWYSPPKPLDWSNFIEKLYELRQNKD